MGKIKKPLFSSGCYVLLQYPYFTIATTASERKSYKSEETPLFLN